MSLPSSNQILWPPRDPSSSLFGIKILDFSTMISGPLCTLQLSDQGASVIKVEQPPLGDLMRYIGSTRGRFSGSFSLLNRGKRSLLLNLKSNKNGEMDIIKELLKQADVLVHNFRPGAMEKLGLSFKEVVNINPNIVYTSISGFGESGPLHSVPVYDSIMQGICGFGSIQLSNKDLAHLTNSKVLPQQKKNVVNAVNDSPPQPEPWETNEQEISLIRQLVVDKISAYTATQGILTALFKKQRKENHLLRNKKDVTPLAQYVSVNMFEAAISFIWIDAAMDEAFIQNDDDEAKGLPPLSRKITLSQIDYLYKLKDGHVVMMFATEKQFAGFCECVGRMDLLNDPRFNSLTKRLANRNEYNKIVRSLVANESVSDFLNKCAKHHVPAAPILSLSDLPLHPQSVHNNTFFTNYHPEAGSMRHVNNPIQLISFSNNKEFIDRETILANPSQMDRSELSKVLATLRSKVPRQSADSMGSAPLLGDLNEAVAAVFADRMKTNSVKNKIESKL